MNFLKKLSLLRKPLRELTYVALVFGILSPALLALHGGFWLQLISHTVVTLVVIGITTVVVLWKNGDIINAMVKAKDQYHVKADGPLAVIFEMSVNRAISRMDSLSTSEGLPVDHDELNVVVKSCFQQQINAYLAIDSHVPSAYYKIYPQFLDDHRIAVKSGKAGVFSWRILAVEKAALIEDYASHPKLFKQFVEWHKENNVFLGQISPADAKSFASTQRLGTMDMGLWSRQCAILFSPPADKTHSLKLRYLSPADKLYAACKLYFAYLAREDCIITITPQGVVLENRSDIDRRNALQSINNLV